MNSLYHTKIITRRVALTVAASLVIGASVGTVTTYALCNRDVPVETQESESHTTEPKETKRAVRGEYEVTAENASAGVTETALKWEGISDTPYIDCDMPTDHQDYLYELCGEYGVDFTLVMALIRNESNFTADIVSDTGDYGYMQINKVNHTWLTDTLGVTDFTDAYQNMRAGVYVLARLFEKYDDTNCVLMAYNMGEGGAAKLWKQGVYTTKYTEKIREYQAEFNEEV